MNIDITFILNWFKKFLVPNPTRDWASVLVIGLIIFVAAVGWGVYVFVGIKSGALIEAGSTTTTPPAPLSRAEIQKVLDIYRARAANYQAGNFPSYPLNDPHLSSGAKK